MLHSGPLFYIFAFVKAAMARPWQPFCINNHKRQRKMNKMFLGLSLLLCAQTAAATDGNFTVKSELKNFGDTVVALIPQDNGYRRDTILVKNDRFNATLRLDEPKDIFLVSMGTLHRTERKRLSIIAVPGETVELKGDLNSRYDIGGSRFYQQYGQFDRELEVAQKALQDFTESLSKRIEAGEERAKVMKEYEEKAPGFEQKINDAIMGFVKSHPDWEAAAAAVTSLEGEKIEETAKLLSATVKAGRMKNYLQRAIDDYKKQAEAEAKSKAAQAAGVVAPDFTLNDIHGKPLSLSSLKGKYVLLDFWGSWCIWCIRGMPQMKEYYKKYAGKFEILGIDCNDPEDKWKAAVKKHELPWLHVYNPKDSKVLADYGVRGFPTKILVGPDGKIVRTVVGEDPAFYQFMDETFGK